MCLRSVDLRSVLRSCTGWAEWDAGLPPASVVPAEVAVPRCAWMTQAPEWEVAHGDLPADPPSTWVLMSSCRCAGVRKTLVKAERVMYSQLGVDCMTMHVWVSVYACQNLLIIILELEENFEIDKLAWRGRGKKPGPDISWWTWYTLEQTQAPVMQIVGPDVLVDPFGPQG